MMLVAYLLGSAQNDALDKATHRDFDWPAELLGNFEVRL
jgi:hypothetical protein